MDLQTLNAYDADAASLAARYAAADVASFHRLLLAHLRPQGRVLEIGCGSGRDAAFLASNGFHVVATDASAAMLDAFRASLHPDLTVSNFEFPISSFQFRVSNFPVPSRTYPDSPPPSPIPPFHSSILPTFHSSTLPPFHSSTLPPFQSSTLPPFHSSTLPSTLPSSVQLAQVSAPLPADHALLSDRFDAVVAMAVVMHIPDAELFEFAFQIRQMLQPGGTLILSTSEGRSLDADSRDTKGRLFRERPAGELALLFERLGFRLIHREETRDGLGRESLRWTTIVLRLDTTKGVLRDRWTLPCPHE